MSELAICVTEFIKTTMSGQESGIYKASKMKSPPIKCDDLNKMHTANVFMIFICDYLNVCYKALILKNDDYVVDEFKKLTSIHGHSEICLLNIIFAIMTNIHTRLDRKLYDISSYEKYMKSFVDQFETIENDVVTMLTQKLSHDCKGIKIETCNADEPLFYVK